MRIIQIKLSPSMSWDIDGVALYFGRDTRLVGITVDEFGLYTLKLNNPKFKWVTEAQSIPSIDLVDLVGLRLKRGLII